MDDEEIVYANEYKSSSKILKRARKNAIETLHDSSQKKNMKKEVLLEDESEKENKKVKTSTPKKLRSKKNLNKILSGHCGIPIKRKKMYIIYIYILYMLRNL